MSVPTISSLSPQYGSMIGGYTLTINGTFSGVCTVTINSISVSVDTSSTSILTVTVPSSTIQDDVDVIVTNENGSSIASIFTYGGNYYVKSLNSETGQCLSVGVDYNKNLYFLVKISGSTTLYTITKGSKFTLSHGITDTIIDMMVISDSSNTYVYITYSVTGAPNTYWIKKYTVAFSTLSPYSSLGTPTALQLYNGTSTQYPVNKFASNCTNSLIYLLGSSTTRGIISVVNYSTVNAYKTSVTYASLTYRAYNGASNYLYGTYSSGIYEIMTSSMTSSAVPTSQQTLTNLTQINLPSIILWVSNDSSFYISDRQTSGSLGGYNDGQIYQYTYSFNDSTGSIVAAVSPSYKLIIRGNSGSGNIYVTSGTTAITEDNYSNINLESSGQFVYKTNSLAYNINSSNVTNLYSGNGSTNSSYIGYLLKYYNPTSGSNTGGDPHIKTINGSIYNLPNDHKFFRLLSYYYCNCLFGSNTVSNLIINCSTKLLTKDNYPLESIYYVKCKNGDTIEYYNNTIESMYGIYRETGQFTNIFEWTYLDKIFIKYGDEEIIIDMNTLKIDSICNINIFDITDINSDRGIYSITHNTYHKKLNILNIK